MAQRLKALPVLPEDPGSILSTHMAAHNCLAAQHPPLASVDIRHTCGAYIAQNTHAHKISFESKKLNLKN